MNTNNISSIRIQRHMHALLSGMWQHRTLILIPTLIMPCVGLLIGLLGTKTYLTYSTILIQEPALYNPFLEDLAVSTNLKDRMPGLKALVHSRHVLSNVGLELGELQPDSRESKIEYYVATMAQKLTVNLVGSDLVRLSYKDTAPARMAEVLNSVTRHLISQIVAPERTSLTGSEDFLRTQLDQRKIDLMAAEKRLAEYKSANSDKLPAFHSHNLESANQLQRLQVEKRTELAGAQAQVKAARQKLTQTNPQLGELDTFIMDIRGRLAAARANYTEQHSVVRGLSRRLEQLQAERERIIAAAKPLSSEEVDRLWNVLSNPKPGEQAAPQSLLYLQLESLHLASQKERSLSQELESIEQALAEVEQRIAAYGETEMVLRELNRDLDAKQNIYNDLMGRWELAQVTRALGDFESGDRIKLIDTPHTPERPINLHWAFYVLGGLLGGLLAGTGLALLLELTDTHIKRQDEVTELTGLPVLVRIPKVS